MSEDLWGSRHNQKFSGRFLRKRNFGAASRLIAAMNLSINGLQLAKFGPVGTEPQEPRPARPRTVQKATAATPPPPSKSETPARP